MGALGAVGAAAHSLFSEKLLCTHRKSIKTLEYSGILTKIDGIWFSAPKTFNLLRDPCHLTELQGEIVQLQPWPFSNIYLQSKHYENKLSKFCKKVSYSCLSLQQMALNQVLHMRHLCYNHRAEGAAKLLAVKVGPQIK